MGWLSSDELTAMRAIEANVMPDTCVISAPGTVSDGAGGATVTYTPVTGGTVACRFDPYTRKSGIEIIAGAEGYVFDFIGTFPYNAPLAGDSRISHNGHTYEITSFLKDKSWQLCIKAYVSEIEI